MISVCMSPAITYNIGMLYSDNSAEHLEKYNEGKGKKKNGFMILKNNGMNKEG